MNTKKDYAKALETFKRQSSIYARYQTGHSDELLLTYLVHQQQPVSQITVELAIKQLVRMNQLVRVDGKSSEDDTQEALAAIVERIDSPDLTKSEIEFFQSLNPRDLADKYWEFNGSNQFRVRFDKAIRTRPFGLIFEAPGRPESLREAAAGGIDESELTADQYHALGMDELKRKLRDPRFKTQVYRLIAEKKI